MRGPDFRFKTALRLGPNNGLIYSEMGASLKAVGRRQEARMALRKAVELNGGMWLHAKNQKCSGVNMFL